MSSTVDHTNVGAYALGVLDDEDRQAFEAHLATCESCTAELMDFSGMRQLLSEVKDHEVLEPVPDEQNVIDLVQHRNRDARRHRRNASIRLAAAGVILVAGGALVGVNLADHDRGMPMPGTPNGPAHQLMLTGERHAATNAATGVAGTVALDRLGWGTHVGLQVSHLRGPLECELVAVSKTGTQRIVTGWSVPPVGYGTPAHPDPLEVHGGTAITRDQLARFDVRVVDGPTIVSVPV